MPTRWVPVQEETKNVKAVVNRLINNIERHYKQGIQNNNIGGGLAEGLCGLALSCGYLNKVYPQQGWDRIAHEYLYAAVKSIYANKLLDMSLYSGILGIAATATNLSINYTRYTTLLEDLNKTISRYIKNLHVLYNLKQKSIPTWKYDLVSGLSGLIIYSLYNKKMNKYVEIPLSILVKRVVENEDLSGYYTSFSDFTFGRRPFFADTYRDGLIDLGMAHGISGVLSALAKSYSAGIRVDGQEDAINKVSKWLIKMSVKDDYGYGWYEFLPYDKDKKEFNKEVRNTKIYKPYIRDIWCYGVAGIARSLFSAGIALNSGLYREFSIKAIKSSSKRLLENDSIPYYFCHGISGVLETYVRFYNDTGDRALRENSIKLLKRLLRGYDKKSSLGYTHLGTRSNNNKNIGLLTGTTGILLPILASVSHIKPEWDLVFSL